MKAQLEFVGVIASLLVNYNMSVREKKQTLVNRRKKNPVAVLTVVLPEIATIFVVVRARMPKPSEYISFPESKQEVFCLG